MRALAAIAVVGALAVAVAGLALLTMPRRAGQRRHWLRPSAIALLVLATDFVARPAELVLGLDTPFPDSAFNNSAFDDSAFNDSAFSDGALGDGAAGRVPWARMLDLEGLFVVWAAIFVAVAVAAHLVAERRWPGYPDDPEETPAPTRRRLLPDDDAVTRFVPVLMIVALAASAVAWRRHGIGDLGFTAKTGAAPVSSVLRAPSLLLAYLGMAVTVSGHRLGLPRRRLLGLAGFVLGAGVSFTWSARDAALLPLVIPALTLLGSVRRPTTARGWASLAGGTLAVVAVLGGLGLGLRLAREQLIFDRTTQRASEGTLMRRVAVTANHTRYDAVLILTDRRNTPVDWMTLDADGELVPGEPPAVDLTATGFDQPGLEVFADAAEVAFSASGTEAAGWVSPARRVRTAVEPGVRNGWPLSALGDWYWAAGWWAVAVGAAVSGAVFGVLDVAWNAARRRSWIAACALSAMFATTVTWGGVGVETIIRSRAYVAIPLGLLVAWRVVDGVTRSRVTLRRPAVTS